ncbi:MAG: LacI family DNA-binding transcriptional regulator [Solirubrobacterales bacterium]
MAEGVLSGEEGRSRRKVTLRDVAARAGVHVSTASRALDAAGEGRVGTATAERVRSAAAELGYSRDLLAAGLKRGMTMSVGVVIANLDNPHNTRVIRGITRVLEASDFVPLIAETGDNRERFERLLEHFVGRRVDAVITSAIHLDGEELLARRLGDAVPVVLAGRGLPDTDHNSVLHDDVTGGALAARHLVSLGHRRLGQLAGPVDIDTFIRRACGFSAAVCEAGAEEIAATAPGSVTPTFIEGRRLMGALLDAPTPPTGVFAPSDVMAVGALDAIASRGLRCPEDVSVVGYDDIPVSRFVSPPLTTIDMPAEELGAEAARMALAAIEDPGTRGRLVELPARLIVRRSTGQAT